MQRYPIAYVRRSSADADNPGDVSREAQEAAIRDLAHRDGHNGNLRVLVDWDRSADEAKESKRTAFLAMLAAIEAGEVTAVYAASLDRLYRSIRTFVRLTDAARKHDTRIVTAREGVLGGDGSPMAQAFAEITAVFAGLELRTAKARAAGSLAVRQARGDHIGRAGYGTMLARNDAGAMVTVPDPDRPLEPIIAAVREAGSILGACKLLTSRGIPAPEGTMWHPTPLRGIIARNAPELLPVAGPTGRRTPTHSALAQLLKCHCGHVMTPEPARRGYRCTMGNRLGREAHGRMWVSESALVPWLMDEAARLDPPGEDDLAALDGLPVSSIAARLSPRRLSTPGGRPARLVVYAEIKRVNWSWSPDELNRVLRALWRYVELGPDLLPVRAEWFVKEWRAAD